jgi:antitoxin ParD1/3/4
MSIFAKNTNTMAPVLLGEYYENFVNEQVISGRCSSVSEVIVTALRLFEQQENKTKNLINELKAGENSSMITDFDRKQVLAKLHEKYLCNEVSS